MATFDFASRDYQTIKQDLLTRASNIAPEWTDRDPSDFGMVLVDLWAYMGDILHYYVDLAAQESFIETATQRESVLAYANLFDYTPNYRRSATATLTIANSGASSYSIPAETQFIAEYDGKFYYFYTTETYSVPAGGTQTITVYEGDYISEEILTTSASGGISQRYILRSENVVPSSVRTFIYEDINNPDEWQLVDNLYTVDSGTGAFSVYVNANGDTEVVFGTRLNGRIPPAGVKIVATYATSSGTDGNIPANLITSFRTSTSSEITIQSSSAAANGSDEESVTSIKTSIQSVTRAQDRAVTLNDFADLALSSPGVLKSASSYDAATSTVTVYPVPYVADYLNYSLYAIPVDATMQTEVEELLQAKAMVGVTVDSATSIVVDRVDIAATVKVDDRYVAPWVEAEVEDSINELFSFDALDIGQEVRIGDVYRKILSVRGVEYAIVTGLTITDSLSSTVSTMDPTHMLRRGAVTLSITGGVSTS